MNYQAITAMAGTAAVIAAGTVSIGATLGFHEMTGSWLTAGLMGTTIAVLLGIGWHIAIRAAANTRRFGNRVGLLAIGMFFVAIAVATSGWSLATAIGGQTAVEQHQKAAVAEYERALNRALVRVDDQRALVEAVSVARSVYSGRVDAEVAGDNGAPGCGPQCRRLQAVAANLTEFQSGIEREIEGGVAAYDAGGAALALARQQVGTPQFGDALAGVESAIVLMNGVNVTNGVSRVGMTTGGGNDPMTAQIVAASESLNSEPAPLPRYVPMNRAEATLAYATDVAGAWIAALAIDSAPFIFLLLVMMLHSEPLIRQQPEMRKRRVPTDDEIRTKEENVIGLRQSAE